MPGKWEPLKNQPTFNTSTMILLTDGRVMVQEDGTEHWHALAPDDKGSYINGKWSTLADMSLWRTYYASGVVKNGRVFLCGGEYSGDIKETNKGEIYDPVTDIWKSIATPPWKEVGDAACCVLPDGRILIGNLDSGACIIYNPATDSWSTTGSQSIRTAEETWILLPDDTILTPQCHSPYQSEKYVISSGTWQNEGSLPATVVDSTMSEIGPGMLLYNGKVIFFGAANSGGHGKTVIYTRPATPTAKGTWTSGPDIPKVSGDVMVSNDCPAALLPNGKVLFTAAKFLNNDWGSPVYFFEYDPVASTITQVPTPPNNNAVIYVSRLMLLPTGQVLFSPSSNNVQVYTPDGGPQDAWRPTIGSVAHISLVNNDFLLQGTQLNGLSQANIYGDDCYPATNYPLVQLTDTKTQEVHFCRTHEFSTMGVATGPLLQSALFTPSGIPDGIYELRVIANGISSHPVGFEYHRTRKPYWLDVGVKREFEYLGKLVAEGDPFHRFEWLVDPDEIEQLKIQVKLLENTVQRLNSLIQVKELPQVGRDIAKEARTAREADRRQQKPGKSRRPKKK